MPGGPELFQATMPLSASTNGSESIRGVGVIGIEQKRVLVAMLPQANRPDQKGSVSHPLGVGPHRQHDAVIGLAVAVPVAALEKFDQGIKLAPGLGRFDLQARRAGGRADAGVLERIAAIGKHQCR